MQIESARAAGALSRQIDVVTDLLAKITAAEENARDWQATTIIVTSIDAGSRLDLLPFGPGSPETTALVLATAKQTYADMLSALQAQLDALA
jgi:hypothetical protein